MYPITLMPGNGIGPEIIGAVKKIVEALDIGINWEIYDANKLNDKKELESFLDSCKSTQILLKAPIIAPKGCNYIYTDWSIDGKSEAPIGYPTINALLRRVLKCHYGIRIAKKYEGITSKYDNVNFVIVRELSEDVYVGSEHTIDNNVAVALKVISKKATANICNFSLTFLEENNRRKITIAHKANVLKQTDGLFLKTAKDVLSKNEQIIIDDRMIDALCAELITKPENFDMIVAPSQYGDILSDIGAAMAGGLGVGSGASYGEKAAIFEATHGAAPDIAGKNIANPTAILLSACLMLKRIGEKEKAEYCEAAIESVLKEKKHLTPDLGGNSTTIEYTNAIIKKIKR